NDVFALELLVHLNGQTHLGEVVHDRQAPEPAAVEERIGYEVHAPALVGSGQHGPFHTMSCRLASARPFTPQVEPGLAIQSINTLVVVRPAFSTQQHEDPPKAVTNTGGGDLFDPAKQWPIIPLPGLVVPRRSTLLHHVASTTNAHPVSINQVAHERLALRGP